MLLLELRPATPVLLRALRGAGAIQSLTVRRPDAGVGAGVPVVLAGLQAGGPTLHNFLNRGPLPAGAAVPPSCEIRPKSCPVAGVSSHRRQCPARQAIATPDKLPRGGGPGKKFPERRDCQRYSSSVKGGRFTTPLDGLRRGAARLNLRSLPTAPTWRKGAILDPILRRNRSMYPLNVRRTSHRSWMLESAKRQ